MRLVGASRWFIALPFLLEALVTAVIGVALAGGGLAAFTHFVLVNGFDELHRRAAVRRLAGVLADDDRRRDRRAGADDAPDTPDDPQIPQILSRLPYRRGVHFPEQLEGPTVRYFPGARQQVAALTVGVVSLAALAVPARPCRRRQRPQEEAQDQVAGQIGEVSDDLDEASPAANQRPPALRRRAGQARRGPDPAGATSRPGRRTRAPATPSCSRTSPTRAQRLDEAETALADRQHRDGGRPGPGPAVGPPLLQRRRPPAARLRELVNAGSLEDLTGRLAVQDVVIGAG